MTITAEAHEIAIVVIAIAFVVFVIALVPTLLQMRRTVKAMEDLSVEGRKTVEGVNGILRRTGEHAGEVEDVVKRLREVGLKYTALADLVADSIRSPLITLLSALVGVEFGLKHLIRKESKETKETDKGGEEDVR